MPRYFRRLIIGASGSDTGGRGASKTAFDRGVFPKMSGAALRSQRSGALCYSGVAQSMVSPISVAMLSMSPSV